MRILILTILFVISFFYFRKEEQAPKRVTQLDAIKFKAAAPKRSERILTKTKSLVPKEEAVEVTEAKVEEESEADEGVEEELNDTTAERSIPTPVNDVAEGWNNEGWNNELKDLLVKLGPEEAEVIYKSYSEEYDVYRSEMDSLTAEKDQKTTSEASGEVEELMGQLDEKYDRRLREIFGTHYETVSEHYNEYMRANQAEE